MEIRAVRRRRRRRDVRRMVRRTAAGALTTQLATVAGLLVFDSVRRKDRPDREFPHRLGEPVPVDGGEVRIYTFGEHLFEDMLADIEAATDRIYFETYIWKGDAVGRRFRQALVDAHERGVDVYIVFDTFANLVVPKDFYKGLPTGIHVRRHPLVTGGAKFLFPSHWGRNHRKLLVVDRTAAYLGGYNIGQDYANRWRDTHARYSGDMVVELENAFVDYWNHYGGRPALPQPARRTWSREMRVHRNLPADMVYPIRNMYLEAIDRADTRVWLTTAYLIPDDAFVRSLVQAAQRGVDVRLIVPHFSNHIVADWLSRVTYERLLQGGVRLLRFENAMVHAKTATIDGIWSTIGTANIDRLSLAGNYEVNMEILDADVARRMEEIFDLDSGNCTELTLDEWTRRPLAARVSEGILSPWRPLL
ncbi:phospholipase D-like domain-containing protein [Janibacter limosus]|jgi:cardiolipin synthase|uniref:Phosphatidylserine/phosphatidylglycerophosphate/ cardiolipin synthase family protein n=1 Tax=Janibacter limosus TaxID=53458 RepID=A0A4P6MT59_9MICO|nr:phospholipase D-like domain-containing protein [Janibacter limosus]QBF46941.1 phosphatidylserine/phosphatidylglycerophosphate/cardiolipin synthase family protein [Janibacter limosus]